MAVIGVGSLGQHHAAKLGSSSDVHLVGVVDPNEKFGREVAERVDTRWFKSADELPENLDGVVIATPTVYHVEAAERFLQAGVATFVEKPLAANVADAKLLNHLAKENGAILQVGHIERFNPAFVLAKERVGHPLYIRCQRVAPYTFRSTDIGVVHDLMIHDIDLTLALTGELPESVDAFGAVGIGPHEDMAVGRLQFSSGTIVDITSSRMCPEAERTIQVWGTSGCVVADLQSRQVQHWQPSSQFRSNPGLVHAIAAATPDPRTLKDSVFGKWIEAETLQADDSDAMSLELQEFVASIREDRTPQVSGTEAVNALIVAEQVLSGIQLWSYQTGGPAVSTPAASGRAAA